MGFLTSARRARFDDPDRALHAVREVGDTDQGDSRDLCEQARGRTRHVPALRHDDQQIRAEREIRMSVPPALLPVVTDGE